jgi:hypothetical protein
MSCPLGLDKGAATGTESGSPVIGRGLPDLSQAM